MSEKTMTSAYMQWAKTQMQARFNLANSGVIGYSLRHLPIAVEQLEINGPSAYGYRPLLEAIAHKCGVAAENIVTTNGASMANFMVLAALLAPGDEVVIEHPTYELIVSAARFLGAEVKRFPRRFENNFQIELADIESVITNKTRLIVLTNLHNPSNALLEQHRLKDIGALARNVGARVMVGEIYLDAMLDQAPPTAALLGNEFITTSSLTKIYGLSGLRCGWIIADAELARRIWLMNDLIANHAPHVAEQISCIAFANLSQIREWSRQMLEPNHRTWNRFLDTRSDLEVPRFPFGTVSFPRLRNGNIDELCEILRNKFETTVVPGRFFEMPQHFRLGMGCEPEVFAEGLLRLGKALDSRSIH